MVKKRANKVRGLAAESVERRASAERSHGKPRHGGDAEPRKTGRWRLAAHGERGTGFAHGVNIRLDGSGRMVTAIPSRFSVFYSMQEPDALVAHVRICAGAPGNRWPYRDSFGFFLQLYELISDGFDS